MEENIGIGLLVGLATASSIYIHKSKEFNTTQKALLLLCVIFPPIQWLGILLVLSYNKNKVSNSQEKISQKIYEEKIKSLNLQVKDLKELNQKGVLTDDEYYQKLKKIEDKHNIENLKYSKEYTQLKNLFDCGLLTSEEFECKLEIITSLAEKTIEEEIIEKFNLKVNLINNETLTILNVPKNSKNILGCEIKISNGKIFEYYISNEHLYLVKDQRIVNFYSAKNIELRDGTKCKLFSILPKPTTGDFIFYHDFSSLPNGNYSLGFLKSINVKENRLI